MSRAQRKMFIYCLDALNSLLAHIHIHTGTHIQFKVKNTTSSWGIRLFYLLCAIFFQHTHTHSCRSRQNRWRRTQTLRQWKRNKKQNSVSSFVSFVNLSCISAYMQILSFLNFVWHINCLRRRTIYSILVFLAAFNSPFLQNVSYYFASFLSFVAIYFPAQVSMFFLLYLFRFCVQQYKTTPTVSLSMLFPKSLLPFLLNSFYSLFHFDFFLLFFSLL